MNFLKYKPIYFTLSILLVGISIISLILWQLAPAIDFTGGSLMEYQLSQPTELEPIRQSIQKHTDIKLAAVQSSSDNHVLIKTEHITQQQSKQIRTTLEKDLNQTISPLRFESIGPTLGHELLQKTLIAVIFTALFILGFLAWTFKNFQYGASALIAMLHDTTILLGSFSLLGHFYHVEVDVLFVTAVLTTLSFSVHDTVVVFDRIRESLKQYPRSSFVDLANKSLTETMSRSVNNSLTIIFMLTALLLLGGSPLRWFVTALLIGTIAGTYSSPFVAVPILVIWENWKKKRRH